MPSHAAPTRRPWSRRLAVVVVLLAATSLSFAPSAGAATPTFGLGAGFDGTKQGTSQACPITGSGGDNTAHDGVVCTGSYTVTQADIDNGSIDDTATATGTPHVGSAVSATSSASVTATQSPALTVVKSAAQQSVTAAGDVVDYSFVVTNTGNVTLDAISVVDAQTSPAAALTSGPTCPQNALSPGTSETCTATYTVSAADIAHGSISDSAFALGTAPDGDPVTSGSSALTVRVEPAARLATTGSPLLSEAGYAVGLLVLGALFLAAGARRRYGPAGRENDV
ncbi:MAG TPA: hypothetical protein VKQ07_09165 [Jatrophihabitantaceae bacterium]|nr:hypothetical protein [Jatrophihabitantaceae bacterium]